MFRAITAAGLAWLLSRLARWRQTSLGAAASVPAYRVDPACAARLPEDNGVQLVFGQVAGIAGRRTATATSRWCTGRPRAARSTSGIPRPASR